MTSVEAFWSKVEKAPLDGCWKWTGGFQAGGYGSLTWNGKTQRAHRISWMLANDQTTIPPGMYICHRCDNPPCVRPDHLFLGTPQDNNVDMVRKGRHARVAGISPNHHRYRTHCKRGHPLAGGNLKSDNRGFRVCRPCNMLSRAGRRERIAPCVCGGEVKVSPSYGGYRGSATFYAFECQKCNVRFDDFGNGDGQKRSAVRLWNRRQKAALSSWDAMKEKP